MFIYGTLVRDLYCSHANQYIQWYMTFIHVATARLSHKPSLAGCISYRWH